MEAKSHDKELRLKVASEIVLGNQAAVAFSRAFYLEDLLIERILTESQELATTCQVLLDQVQKFTEDILNSDSSAHLTPLSETSVRCQCSEMLERLGTVHQPALESFRQKFIKAKGRRQAKSCLLETLSAQNQNITTQFSTMTLSQLAKVHIPEFSCFINDSDFGQLEQLADEWDDYRKPAKEELDSFDKKINGFVHDVEKNKQMREYTCDMILAKITQQQQASIYGSSATLKKKGVFHKFSTLLRRRTIHSSSANLNGKMKSLPPSPTMSSKFTVVENSEETF